MFSGFVQLATTPPPFTGDIAVVLGLLLLAFLLFAKEWASVDVVAIVIVLVLALTGILETPEALAGFGHPAVIGVGALFIVSEGLLRTGALGVVANRLERWSGGVESRFLLLTLLIVLVSSAFLNNTPVVAMFIPIVLGICRKLRINPSRMLIPLSYAAILGGTCTLIGTSTNILVSSIIEQERGIRLGMFEFTALGALLSVVGLAYLVLFSRRVIPERSTITSLTSLGGGALREYATELEVRPGGALADRPFAETPFAEEGGVRVLQVIRGEEIVWPPFEDLTLRAGDALVIAGTVDDLITAREQPGLASLQEILTDDLAPPTPRETELAELLVQSNSVFAGQLLGELQFRRRFGIEVIAILRHGMHLRQKLSEHPLRVGDVLLVQGTQEGLHRIGAEEGLVLLSGIDDVLVRREKAPMALIILIGVIAILATQLRSMAEVALLGAVSMILSGCLPAGKVYEAVHWRVLVLIAGMLALGLAMDRTGAANWIAYHIIHDLDFLGPRGLIIAILVLSALLTEVVSNNAVAVLMVPVALSLAGNLEIDGQPVSFYPFIFAVAYGASCSFLTPIGYQTNTLVYGAGGYRFSDFFRAGLPLVLLVWILGGWLIPVIWPLVP
ncbi:MAG: SLC13 family permease [Planctomycetota bacterium]